MIILIKQTNWKDKKKKKDLAKNVDPKFAIKEAKKKNQVGFASVSEESPQSQTRESQSKSSWISSLLLCRFFNGGRCRGDIGWGCIPAETEMCTEYNCCNGKEVKVKQRCRELTRLRQLWSLKSLHDLGSAGELCCGRVGQGWGVGKAGQGRRVVRGEWWDM